MDDLLRVSTQETRTQKGQRAAEVIKNHWRLGRHVRSIEVDSAGTLHWVLHDGTQGLYFQTGTGADMTK